MRLISLTLKNFRQHIDTHIPFDQGLTGIIGSNGAGKSTVLEAIGFALYGVAGVRGKKDDVKSYRAAPRSSVSVVLEFAIGSLRYRVVRGMSSSELMLISPDGEEKEIAASLTGVTDQITRILGMTRSEFFSTYFTGQKDLAVMASLGPTERARFISRVLGYDRLEVAQTIIRDQKRTISAELSGLESGLPSSDEVEADRVQAQEQLEVASAEHLRLRGEIAEKAKLVSEVLRPAWESAQRERDKDRDLAAKAKVVRFEIDSLAREMEGHLKKLAEVEQAEQEYPGIAEKVEGLAATRAELTELDRLAQTASERHRLDGQLQVLMGQSESSRRESSDTLIVDRSALTAKLTDIQGQLKNFEAKKQTSLAAWQSERAVALSELAKLRTDVSEKIKRRDEMDSKGADGLCDSCGQPLGASWNSARERLVQEIAAVTELGTLAKAKAESLSAQPAEIQKIEGEIGELLSSESTVSAEIRNLESRISEIDRSNAQADALQARIEAVQIEISALPDLRYDSARHASLREEYGQQVGLVAKAEVLKKVIASRGPLAESIEAIAEKAQAAKSDLESLISQQSPEPFDDARCESIRSALQNEEALLSTITHECNVAKLTADQASERLDRIAKQEAELVEKRKRIEELTESRLIAEELDRAYTVLRTDLNSALRPEITDIASEMMSALTEGRYEHAEFGDDYQLTVIDAGTRKSVLSGGEEDVCNLVLRLAISQLIAERSGQPFSLLILDEVFSHLDEARRAATLQLLRRLGDRYSQVIVITHHEEVKDALDHVIQVKYNALTGISSIDGTEVPLLSEAA